MSWIEHIRNQHAIMTGQSIQGLRDGLGVRTVNNKDKVASYNKHSYIRHKDKIRKYANEVIQCESCTCYVTRLNMARHRNTDKCKVLSQTLSNN